jgi:hypothetical protein
LKERLPYNGIMMDVTRMAIRDNGRLRETVQLKTKTDNDLRRHNDNRQNYPLNTMAQE